MTKIFSSFCLLVFSSSLLAQNKVFEVYTDSTLLCKENDALIADIENRVKAIDITFSFKGLKTITDDSPGGYFLYGQNVIHHATWDIEEKFIGQLATELTGSKEKGKEFVGLFVHGFFLAHEVGHAMQFHTNNWKNENLFANEYQASEIALLYWISKGKKKELDKCYELAKLVVSTAENPFPENVDIEKYFTEHYNEFLQNPKKYGYVMFTQIVKVFEDKSLPDFDTYVKTILLKN